MKMNKFLFSVLKGSVLQSPFVPAKKYNDADWQAAGNLVGSILGFFGNERTNAANLQIARETNEQNKQLFHEQLDYQTGMWKQANEYNDPKNQSKRLAAAGINPAAVLGNGSAVSDVSSPSAPSAPHMIAPQMQNYDVGASLQNALNNYINAKNVNAQTRLIDEQAASAAFDNEHRFERYKVEMQEKLLGIKQRIEDYEYSKSIHPKERDLLDKKIDNEFETYNILRRQYYEMEDSYIERKRQLKLGNDLTDVEIENKRLERSVISAQSINLLSQAGLNNATANRVIQLLPFERGNMALNFLEGNQNWENRKATGFHSTQELYDAAETLANTANIENMTDIQKKNFLNWWKRYAEPIFGGASSIATALILKKLGK